jgi:plastocyanin
VRRAVAALLAACALLAAAPGAPGAGTANVSVIDNAFLRGVQRPDVRVAPGTTIVWRWRSQQSHGVAVRSGPVRFASAIKVGGAYRRRLTRRGTYRIVCPLHAPGMKMTVTVR